MSRVGLSRLAVGTLAGLSVAGMCVLPAQAAASSGWRIVHRYAPGGYASYKSIAVSGTHAWAVGSGPSVAADGVPAAAYFSNGRWSASPLPKKPFFGELTAVSADAPDDAWATSDYALLHWHGGRWTVARTWYWRQGPPGPLWTGITALSPTDVWAFGDTLGVWHLHGRTWTRVASHGRHEINAASAVSARDMWAIGGTRKRSIMHYVNGSWRTLTTGVPAGFEFGGIYASSANSVWVTASPVGGTGLDLLHLHGTTWKTYPLPGSLPIQIFSPYDPFGSISPDGHGGFWIAATSVGLTSSWLLHFSSSGHWSQVPMGRDIVWNVVRIPRTAALWSVGSVPRTKARSSFTNAVIWGYGSAR